MKTDMGSVEKLAEFAASNMKNEFCSSSVHPRVLKQGRMCKKSEHFLMLKSENYFVLLEDGRFLVFSSKPELDFCSAKPKQVFLMRSVPCLGLCKGLEDYRETLNSEQENESNSNNNNNHQSPSGSYDGMRNAFTVQLIKNGKFVERTYCTTTAAERDEWRQAFAEIKEIMSKKQKRLSDFEVLKNLGSGYFGRVILCREKSSDHPFAMKLIKKFTIAGTKQLNHTLSEKRLLQNLIHPFLVHMKYSFQTNDKLCFVMEYLIGGDLYNLVGRAGRFSEKSTRFYSAEVISVIGFLHEKNILYRDLKLENIMIDKEGHIRLVDLGLCKELPFASDKTRTFCGTRECMAPEALNSELYGLAVDWWGVGIIMYEMLCSHLPFNNSTPQELIHSIMTAEVTFTRTVSKEVTDVITGLLRKDPCTRLGCCGNDALEVQRHPYFKDISWDDVPAKKLQPPFVPHVASDVDTRYFDDQFTTMPLKSVSVESEDTQLTSMERNKFGRISDYSEESDG